MKRGELALTVVIMVVAAMGAYALLTVVWTKAGSSVASTQATLGTEKLAATRPALKAVCVRAGGCKNVSVWGSQYDGSGNSDLRNKTVFWVSALGTQGVAVARETQGVDLVDAAALDWIHSENYPENMDETVYPNASPCDSVCLDRTASVGVEHAH